MAPRSTLKALVAVVTIYVDMLMHHGASWGKSCHMFSDQLDLSDLHRMSEMIGLKRGWIDLKRPDFPHYDIDARKRGFAIEHGAVAIDKRDEWRPIYLRVLNLRAAVKREI